MDALFETEFCKDLKVVTAPPDIVKTVEKGRASGSDPELSDAAAARYRAVLDRIAWWGQSRPDLSRWMSILSQGQSKPTACFEQALRQVIRFSRDNTMLGSTTVLMVMCQIVGRRSWKCTRMPVGHRRLR